MSKAMSGLRLGLLLALLLGSGTQPGYAVEPAAENLLLRGDFREFLQVFRMDEASSGDPIAKFLIAHANGAIGRNRISDSLFSSMTDREKRRCLAWADSLQLEHPGNYIVAYLSADAKFRLGRWAESITGFSSSLKMLRDHMALIQKARGRAWAERGRDSAAIAEFSAALETNPDDAATYFRRGRSFASAGRYDDAILDYDTALRLDRRLVLAAYYRAVAIDEAGGFMEAVEAYRSFIDKAAPEDSEYVALAEQTIAELEEAIATGDTLAAVDSLLAGVAGSLEESLEVGMDIVIDSVEFMSERGEQSICDVMPKAVSVPEPEYPDQAAEAGITGVVNLKVLIGPDGSVVNVMADTESGVDSVLIQAAMAVARDGEWEPGRDNELPAPCWAEYSVEFAEGGEVANNIPEPGDSSLAQADSAAVKEPPQPMFIPEPVYPDSAMEEGITGVVEVKAFIDKSGGVRDVVVIEASGLDVGFEDAALQSSREGRWIAAMDNGEPVMSSVIYKVDFSQELLERQKERKLALEAAQAAADSAALAAAHAAAAAIEIDTSAFSLVSDEITEADEYPEALNLVLPVFPESAPREEIDTANVRLKVLVDKEGKVTDAAVEKASVEKMGFEEAALEAAKKSEWKPAMYDKKPIACWVTYQVTFSPGTAERKDETPPELEIVSQPVAEVTEEDSLSRTPGEPDEPDSATGTLAKSDEPDSISEDRAEADKDESIEETEERQLPPGMESLPQPVDVPLAEFPKLAADSGLAGKVIVKALVNREGNIGRASVERDPDTYAGFEEAATKAAMKGKWKPAIRKGNAVPYPVEYQVEFTADGTVINHIEYADGGVSGSGSGAGTGQPGVGAGTDDSEEEVIPSISDTVIVDREPLALYVPKPEFPEEDDAKGKEGVVKLRILVDKTGKVRDAVVMEASPKGAGFEQKAIETAMQIRWSPAKRKDEPVFYWTTYEFKFTPEGQ